MIKEKLPPIKLNQKQLQREELQFEETSELSTNQVLIEKRQNKDIYYLPCYIRFKLKDVHDLDIDSLRGTVSGTLLFSFYYGEVEQKLLKQLMGPEKAIMLQFNREDSIHLIQERGITLKHDHKNRTYHIVVRQTFECQLEGQVFMTPFQILHLYLTVVVQSVLLNPKHNKGLEIQFKFNCMKSDEALIIGYNQSCSFGNYHLANNFLHYAIKNNQKNPFEYISTLDIQNHPSNTPDSSRITVKSNKDSSTLILDEENKEQRNSLKTLRLTKEETMIEIEGNERRAKHFQYWHMRIPLYRYPASSLVSIFLPLWILAFINLSVFFQTPDLGSRLGTIAVLALAFIAFIPTINNNIPDTPKIKFVQILVYSDTLAGLLCLIQSLYLKYSVDLDNYYFYWEQDGFFITALVLNCLNVFIVLAVFFIHKIFWEPIYIRKNQKKHKLNFVRKKWQNEECDQQFEKWLKAGIIKSL